MKLCWFYSMNVVVSECLVIVVMLVMVFVVVLLVLLRFVGMLIWNSLVVVRCGMIFVFSVVCVLSDVVFVLS